MSDILLPLLVTIPLTLAVFPLLFGLRFKNAGWPIALGGSLAVTAMASLLTAEIYTAETTDGQRFIHEMAGYPAPYGIELVGDGLSTLIALLIGVVSVAVLIYGRTTGPQSNAFYSGYLLLTGGLLGMALTGDLFNLFVFLEIVGLVTYALVASDDSGMAAYGALKYLFLGTVGASLYLIGVGYALVATGTLNMLDLQSTLAEIGYTDPLVQASFGFILIGLLLKIAVFPLHTWQPDAYTYAPDTVSAYISALVSTTAAYALIRISYDVFTVDFFAANPLITDAVVLVASISIVVGSLLAAMQTEIKRVFAYSSVAQFGMIVVAIGLNSQTALFGAVIHLVGHGLMKATLFMGAGVLSTAYGATTVSDYAGLAKRAPISAGAMAVTGLALVGIPPSVGILGKWYIALGAVESGSWSVAIVIFISTLLTLIYVARIIETLYFNAPTETSHEEATASESVDRVAISDSPVTDGGHTNQVAVERIAVVAILAVSTVVLFASVDLFATLLDPVFGRFF
jgi:multicomponent Na+:H+ antiporter subunit D